jgi:hypothetical protein
MNADYSFRQKLLAIAIAACVALPTAAADTVVFDSLQLGDTTVKNARVKEATPTHVTVWYDGGATKLKRQDLPRELKALYPYDAAAAAEFEKQQAAERETRTADALAKQQQAKLQLKASLLQQKPIAEQKLAAKQEELRQLEKLFPALKGQAHGKPNSEARQKLDDARTQKNKLISDINALQTQITSIKKQLDALP